MPRQFAARSTHPNAGIAAGSFIKTTDDAVVKSYDEALAFLNGENAKILASNVLVTVLPDPMASKIKEPLRIAIRLYKTDIIIYHRPTEDTEVFEADNGGFFTPTTSTRCTQFGPRGYHFGHTKKKLHANGHTTGKGVLLPVWTFQALKELAEYKGLEVVDFINAGFVKSDELNNGGLTEVFDKLREDDTKWLANRVQEMPTPPGKTAWILVGLHDNKPLHVRYGDYPVKWMYQKEAAEANEDVKAYRQKWVAANQNERGQWQKHPTLAE